MRLSYDDTKRLVDLALDAAFEDARARVHAALVLEGNTEGQFYDGIVEHAPSFGMTSNQWFELLSRFPNRMLWSQLDLKSILSEEQFKRLPPITG